MHQGDDRGIIALVAGAGSLPREAARLLRRQGYSLCAIGFSGLTDTCLKSEVEASRWLPLGQLEAMAGALHEMGASEILLLGTVPKLLLYDGRGIVDPDSEALRVLAEERDRGDEPLMLAVARWLEDRGFRLCDQGQTLEAMLVKVGPLTARPPSRTELDDFALGWPVVQQLGRVGIGQCVIVNNGSVLAVEAIEGTDAVIRRSGKLGGAGATVIKATRPGQDRRFDLPAVGVGTIEAMSASGATALAVEAGSTLVLDREQMIAAANDERIAVWGFSTDRNHS